MMDERFEPDLDAWEAWSPREIDERAAGIAVPWCVVGGWGLDLFLGRETRAHEDLEIAVPCDRIGEMLPAFAGYELFAVSSGYAWPFRIDAEDGSHQTWVRDPATQRWRLDLFREPHEGDTWICRRNPAIRMPYHELIQRTPEGIPYAVPETILLFKAKATREKDESDFTAVLPRLERGALVWLHDALRLTHPDHAWIGRVDEVLRAT